MNIVIIQLVSALIWGTVVVHFAANITKHHISTKINFYCLPLLVISNLWWFMRVMPVDTPGYKNYFVVIAIITAHYLSSVVMYSVALCVVTLAKHIKIRYERLNGQQSN